MLNSPQPNPMDQLLKQYQAALQQPVANPNQLLAALWPQFTPAQQSLAREALAPRRRVASGNSQGNQNGPLPIATQQDPQGTQSPPQAAAPAQGTTAPPGGAGQPIIQNGVPMLAGGINNGGAGSGMLTPQPASLLQNNAANPGYEANLAALAAKYPALAQQLNSARGIASPTLGFFAQPIKAQVTPGSMATPTAGGQPYAPDAPVQSAYDTAGLAQLAKTGSAPGYIPTIGTQNGEFTYTAPGTWTRTSTLNPVPAVPPPPSSPTPVAPPVAAAPQAPLQAPIPSIPAPQLSGFTGTPVQATQQVNEARAATPPPPPAPAVAPMSGVNSDIKPTQTTNDFFAQMRAMGVYGEGGPLNEIVDGIGRTTGKKYIFGEKGKEWVVPEGKTLAEVKDKHGKDGAYAIGGEIGDTPPPPGWPRDINVSVLRQLLQDTIDKYYRTQGLLDNSGARPPLLPGFDDTPGEPGNDIGTNEIDQMAEDLIAKRNTGSSLA